MRLEVYSDGGSRGNPGDSAIAFKIVRENGRVVKRSSRRLGIRTNNQAEYEALISALTSASTVTAQPVPCHCYLDSELVVKQLNGDYTIKTPELKMLWSHVHELQKFRRITFTHVPRTNPHIAEVDRLVNAALARLKDNHVGASLIFLRHGGYPYRSYLRRSSRVCVNLSRIFSASLLSSTIKAPR